jgi:hypothetical protein
MTPKPADLLKTAERASRWPAQRIINFLAVLGFLGGLACQFGVHP